MAHDRPWFRIAFSLRTLFVVVTVIACWLAFELNWIRERHDFLVREAQRYEVPGGEHMTVDHIVSAAKKQAPGMLWIFSEEGVQYFSIFVQATDRSELTTENLQRQARAKSLFPEADDVGFDYREDGHLYDIDFKRRFFKHGPPFPKNPKPF